MTIDNEVGTSIMFDQAGSLLYSVAAVFPVGLLFLIILLFGIRASGLPEEVTAWWGRWRHNQILIVVEHPVEAAAMRAATAGQRHRSRAHRRHGAEYLATYSRARLYLKIAEPGDTVQDAARCLSRVRPDLVILAGICRGLHPERLRVGDIVLDSVLAHVHPDPTAPGGLRLDASMEEPYYLLLARLRVQDNVRFEGFVLCHGDLPPSWTLAEDLAELDPRAVAASPRRDQRRGVHRRHGQEHSIELPLSPIRGRAKPATTERR